MRERCERDHTRTVRDAPQSGEHERTAEAVSDGRGHWTPVVAVVHVGAASWRKQGPGERVWGELDTPHHACDKGDGAVAEDLPSVAVPRPVVPCFELGLALLALCVHIKLCVLYDGVTYAWSLWMRASRTR